MTPEIKTQISFGYIELIKTFAEANNLDLTLEPYGGIPGLEKIKISYDPVSETAYSITFLSAKHLGFENMLNDYLIRCGIHPVLISEGRVHVKRDLEKLEQEWMEYRKKLGFR